jgi:hypothetical protein
VVAEQVDVATIHEKPGEGLRLSPAAYATPPIRLSPVFSERS